MDDKIKDKIQKLLNLANGNAAGGEHERDTAMKMALKLLTKHNLDLAAFEKQNKIGHAEDRVSIQDTQYAYPWMRTVANALAELYFCKFFSQTIPQYKRLYTFVGKESNAMMAMEMTRYVIKSIQREGARERKRLGEREPFENSFLNGASQVIYRRCLALKEEAIKENEEEVKADASGTGTALVLASFYEAEMQSNIVHIEQNMGIKLVTKSSNMRSTSQRGKAAGAAYAQTLNLNRQIK